MLSPEPYYSFEVGLCEYYSLNKMIDPCFVTRCDEAEDELKEFGPECIEIKHRFLTICFFLLN